ncbi:carboxypeptidase regulatory-like domain-containing protein [Aeromicrobium sp. UC242_57]|uniref:carboxypeptidase regulatory-like domain-containing protein n=1 Tax=Aeromicrobium sp. UC242_57 TaxID=3374624 RepID=UPI00379337CB
MASYCGDFSSYWIGGVDYQSAAAYTVTADKVTAVPRITINYGTMIAGKVTSDAEAGAPSVPLRDIDVTALQYDTGTQSWVSRGSVSTAADGTYRLRNLQPGEYILRFIDYDGEFVEEFFSNSATMAGATTITVAEAGVTGKNVSLASQSVDTTGVLLSGVVKNRYGSGIDDIDVSLYNIGQDRWVENAETNRRGRFSFKDIEPGDYRISFYDDRERYVTDATTSLRVKVGTTKGADVSRSLVAFGKISGTVALPASTRTVWSEGEAVLFSESGDLVDSDRFDAGEGYSFGYLTPGRYKLRFSGYLYRSESRLPLIGQWWSKKYSMDSATTITIGDASVVKGVNVALTQQLAAIAAPKVTGTAKRGKTLRTTVGDWNGVAGNKYAYAWFRNGKAIKGATKSRPS